MRKAAHYRLIAILLVLVALAVLAQHAWAGGSWKLGVTFRLGSLHADADLRGTGNQDYAAVMTAYATVTAMCQNKSGHVAHGHNPVTTKVVVTDVFSTKKNGRAVFELVAANPSMYNVVPAATPKEAGCPNSSWKLVGVDQSSVVWEYVTITGYPANQFNYHTGKPLPGAQVLFDADFACSYGSKGKHKTFGCTKVSGNVPPPNWWH